MRRAIEHELGIRLRTPIGARRGPQGNQNKIFGAGRAVLFISDMSPAGEPSSGPLPQHAAKFDSHDYFCVA